jgi:formylglycine-generating enzyme required for sulfatase activity
VHLDSGPVTPGATTVSGRKVVAALLLMIALAAGGLILYKRQPRMQTLPFKLETSTGMMYLVPAGATLHGVNDTRAVVPAFYIDQTEVANEHYARFCKETGHALPANFPADRPADPVVNVTIADATEFAKWAGKRLPDPIEWEKAARGSRGGKYPWGDSADPRRANVRDNPVLKGAGVLPADSMPQHASPSRALHMVGNVAEYVRISVPPLDDRAKEPWYTVRGGSYTRTLAESAPWLSIALPMSHVAPDVGFRCAKDPPR